MKTKILSIALIFVLFLTVFSIKTADAQSVSFPDGCASALGYSISTGRPCSGTRSVINGPINGCATALGYSVTTGRPCSGGDEALSYLAGCTSIYGYSTRTGQPCNGTNVAYLSRTTTPGLPRTGYAGDILLNILLLSVTGLLAFSGIYYLSKEIKAE